MEFFGITSYGPQNYVKDLIKTGYKEPMSINEVAAVMENVLNNTTCPRKFKRPDVNVIRTIDCYLGNVNGFAYGSAERLKKIKIKGIMKPLGPPDMYRLPPTTTTEYGWFLCDPAVTSKTWYKGPKHPNSMAPNTRILDEMKRKDKYASFFT